MAKEMLKVLFGVEGGSALDTGSGKQIVDDLTQIVNNINNQNKIPKIKFDFDFSAVDSKLDNIKKKIGELGNGSGSGGAKKKGKTGGVTEDLKQQNKDMAKGIELLKEEISLRKQLSREMTRNKTVSKDSDGNYYASLGAGGYTKQLVKDYNAAKQAVESWKAEHGDASAEMAVKSAQLSASLDLQNQKFIRNGEESWAKLSAKVNDYIQRVEYAASRDSDAARGLKELADIANSGDPHRYDELNKKLAEVRGYINANSLATETWAQKMKKAFGDSVRGAMVASATAILAKTANEIYQSVETLDKAVVNLQIATGKTREEVQRLVKSYSEMARELGATTAEVADSADTWLRQGYSLEETNTLIKNGMMLSKLGQLDATTATTDLTSAMKGYKVSVEDSLGIVDKLTAVDMAAAASAGGLATAMAETATGANLAGVSMDKLLGYIATVKEVTQDADESVGTFFRTVFARMGNIKAGKFVDSETGESLSDVEKVLEGAGIKLRVSETEFRNFGAVLDEVAKKWSTYDDVTQHAIATALGGTRQQEKLIVLLSNYTTATKYAEIATNATGTATEKWSAYMDSAEAKTNSITASIEKLSQSLIKSDWVVAGKGALADVISLLADLTELLGGLPGLSAIAFAAFGKNLGRDKLFSLFLTIPRGCDFCRIRQFRAAAA